MSEFVDKNEFEEFKEGFEYDFTVRRFRDHNGNVLETADYVFYAFENSEETLDVVSTLLIGKYIAELSDRVDLVYYKLIMQAANKAIENPEILDLSEDEKKEMATLACEIKKKLPTLKIIEPNSDNLNL